MIGLRELVENECFIVCDLLSTDRFITFCRDRGIETSCAQLEQFEKLGLLYPVARVRFPKIKVKVRYSEDRRTYQDLGILQEGESWNGETRDDYSSFWFTKEFALDWLREGCLWQPNTRDFEPWSTFDGEERRVVESYYSMFQCLHLYSLDRPLAIQMRTEWLSSYTDAEVVETARRIAESSRGIIRAVQESHHVRADIALICQAISNRYYPETQSDRRTLNVSHGSAYHDWSWHKYRHEWNARSVREAVGVENAALVVLQECVSHDAGFVDPLERWYSLIRFISVDQRSRLKGEALLAQTFYAMEEMLRLFYQDLTDEKLNAPNESRSRKLADYYGDGIPENDLQFLEFLTNEYHLNPRPRLLLLVEGVTELQQMPRISSELIGYPFERLGIRIEQLGGISGAGKVERLIDHYHYQQTIVYLILDNDNHAKQLREALLNRDSKYPDVMGKITKEEFVVLWEKSFEFDNFSDEEIATGMTELIEGAYTFSAADISAARKQFGKEGDPLSNLYRRVVGHGLAKPKLAAKLVDFMLNDPAREFDDKGTPRRPITAKLAEICHLASRNYQPVRLKDWRATQQSGYLRGVPKSVSPGESSGS